MVMYTVSVGVGVRQQQYSVFSCPITNQIKMDELWRAERTGILLGKQTNRRRRRELSVNPSLPVW